MLSSTQRQLLTHYALGEHAADHLPEIQRLLADEPEAQVWIDQVQATAAALQAALASESPGTTGLDERRRATIRARLRPALRWFPWAMAASVMAAIGCLGVLLVEDDPPQSAVAPQPPVMVVPARPVEQPQHEALRRELERPDFVFEDAQEAETVLPLTSLDMPTEVAWASGPAEVCSEEAGSSGAMGCFMGVGSASRTAPQPAVGTMSPHNEGIIGQRYSQRQRLSGAVPPQPSVPQHRTDDRFTPIVETAFCDPRQQPLSTFGLDVDTASYAIVRRSITEGRLPPPEAVRIEEMLNSFRFADPSPPAEAPFAVAGEVSACPWQPEHRLVRIGVSAMRLERRPPCRLVFLIDVSGSMDGPTRLPLVRQALETLVEQLRAEDRVAIVTYSDSARVALPSTRGDDRDAILTAIRRLSASGSTNGAGGIQLAYRIAQEHAVAGVNRVFLCTDGDFNVGISDRDGLRRFITERRQTGLTLTALGFGMGNLHDSTLQVLADSGNGTYAYIDDDEAARTTLVRQLDRHLVMVAKDAKVQVEFNPAAVASYRLIGYEKRALADRDFANDQVDSGDIGAGAHVTVLYQVEPRSAGGLRYQHQPQPGADEMLFVQMRWKRPDQDRSELLRWPLRDDGAQDSASPDQRFAAAVAAFGLALRQSPHRGDATFALAEQLARTGAGRDDDRCAFVALVRDARRLEGRD